MQNSSNKTTNDSNSVYNDRAKRFIAEDAFSSKDVSLIINDRDVAIYDFSKSGITCFLPMNDIGENFGISSFSDTDGADLMEGNNAVIILKVNDKIAFEGKGQIVRREKFARGKKLALKFIKNDLNVVDIV